MKYSFLLAFLIVVFTCTAQDEDTGVSHSFGVHGHYGFIIPHAEEIETVSETNPVGVEIDFNRINTSYDSWKVFNAYWSSGIQVAYFNFMNPETVGSAFLASVYVEPIVARWSGSNLSIRGGAGLSFHTRVFNTIKNPDNKFFSTRISFPVYVSLRFSHSITSNTLFTISANYNHISNGGIKQPNFGMNFPTLSIGALYFPSGIPILKNDYTSILKKEPGFQFVTRFLTAYRVVDETDLYPEKGAFAFGLHLSVSRQLTGFYSLNAGAEIISDGAIKELIRREGKALDHKRVALLAGQDFSFGRAIFAQYLGFYVYSPYKAFRNIYQKYELSYRITPALSAGVFLKAHLYVAELMGLQLGFRL